MTLEPVGSHDELLFDAGGGPPVGRRCVGLEGEHHALLDLDRGIDGVQPADDRPFVETDSHAVAELEPEGIHLVSNPNSSALGHTLAIWSVVAPGLTRSIAASIHSRDCLKASRWAWVARPTTKVR